MYNYISHCIHTMWFNVDKSPKILKQWKSLISVCNQSSRAQKSAKITKNSGGGSVVYSTFWIWSFCLFWFQIFPVSMPYCAVSMTDLSGFRWDLSGFQFGSVWCESEWRLHDCQLGVGGNGTKDERIFSRVRLVFYLWIELLSKGPVGSQLIALLNWYFFPCLRLVQ